MHKLRSACFRMRKLFPILNMQMLKAIVFAHFHFLVNYGIIFLGNTSSMQKVFLTEKKKGIEN